LQQPRIIGRQQNGIDGFIEHFRLSTSFWIDRTPGC
jgi:hypothetical protein